MGRDLVYRSERGEFGTLGGHAGDGGKQVATLRWTTDPAQATLVDERSVGAVEQIYPCQGGRWEEAPPEILAAKLASPPSPAPDAPA